MQVSEAVNARRIMGVASSAPVFSQSADNQCYVK